MPVTLLTDIAENKLAVAAGSGNAVAVTHIALGDGLGAAYDPSHSATVLRRERARLPIEKRHITAPNSWRVKAEFGPETPAFAVREMGFFDGDGDLIAIWAGKDVQPRQTGVIAYLVDHVLNFSRVDDGLIIVDAPDDQLFDHAVSNLETHAIIADEQFKQRLLIRDLQNALTARISAFMDDADDQIAQRQGAYDALAANLIGVVGNLMFFSGIVDPDDPAPTNVDGGTFNSIKELIDAAPSGAFVTVNLVRGKVHRIDQNIYVYGRNLRFSATGNGERPIIAQGYSEINGRSFRKTFNYIWGVELHFDGIDIEPDPLAAGAAPLSGPYNSLVRSDAPNVTAVSLRHCKVTGDGGYAAMSVAHGAIVHLATYQSTFDGAVVGVSWTSHGNATITNLALTLLNGAALSSIN